ncbi:MAG TPA: carbon-nitrogen hydrolase family protein [Chitinophagaceae bacterium]|nr:carbon-nitrogen hydrolase family protein [Chitinophagaceae bacterium]
MILSVAQTKPFKGNVAANLAAHITLAALAAGNGAGVVMFPELSITGYEPGLAAQLATSMHDTRYNLLQQLADARNITICAGMPIAAAGGVMIGLLVFTPHAPGQLYCKQHLHKDELPYFIPGTKQLLLPAGKYTIGLAICYEIAVNAHAAALFNNGANVYMASVAKSVTGMQKAAEMLAATARTYNTPVLVSNCVGHCDNFNCGGASAVWDGSGTLLAQLGAGEEGIIVYNLSSNTAAAHLV